jgi:integrase
MILLLLTLFSTERRKYVENKTCQKVGSMSNLKDNKINFTKANIQNLPLPKVGKINYFYDVQVNGLGIMVFASNTKTFFLYKRINGKPDKIKLGRFPEISVEQARKATYALINKISDGIDPKQEKEKIAGEMSFSQIFDEFMEKHSKPHKKSWKDDQDKYRLYLSVLAKKKISLITKADVLELQTSWSKNSGIYTANRLLALLSTVFNFAINNFALSVANPCLGIKKFKEKSRERFIQGDEILRFFQALNQEPNEVFRDFFYICLLTGARRRNVQSMNWQDVNFNRNEWKIIETKNGESQVIPLIPQAVSILKARHDNKASDFVFPSDLSKAGHIEEPKKAWKRILKAAGIEDLRIHDLRRTLGSWQAATGANSYIIGKSLGHKTQSATAIYARLNIDPVRESVERAADAMFALVKT